MKNVLKMVTIILVCALSVTSGLIGTARAQTSTFTNPIMASGADPSVVYKDGYYYHCASFHGASGAGVIQVGKAERLQDIGRVPLVTVYDPSRDSMYYKEVWAPELQYLDGKWYIYFTADDGVNANHRMHVIESATEDPQGAYTFKGKIADSTDKWAITGTVLVTDNGQKYFVWSGLEGDVNVRQIIYIAPMSNPWTISGERIELSRPTQGWETIGDPDVNEAPTILQKDGGNPYHLFGQRKLDG